MTSSGDTVFVVDDDPAVREALGSLIKSVGLEIAAFDSAQTFLHAARPDVPSCLVLDVRMPGVSGLDLQQRLAADRVPIPIIFMTGHGDVPMSVRAMKAGAVEFLPKPFREQDLLDAIHLALMHDRARQSREWQTAALRQRYQSLTPREREVVGWVIAGRLNKEIAQALGTSEITVKVHRGQAMRKLGAGSVAELVQMLAALEVTPQA